MNCPRCNAPLAANARFCSVCGLSISPNNPASTTPQSYQPDPANEPPTIPPAPWQAQELPPQGAPLQGERYSQGPAYVEPGTMQSRDGQVSSDGRDMRPRRRRSGCLARSLFSLILALVLLGGAWFFLVRPYVHSLVQNQIDQALSTAVNQIDPTKAAAIPPGAPVPVNETLIDNLFVLNSAPSDPVQNEQMHITPSGMTLDFTVYGYSCSVTGVPQLVNGQVVVNNVNVQGIVSLVMSSDEMQKVLNRHLADAQSRLNRPVTGLNLMDQELDLTLG